MTSRRIPYLRAFCYEFHAAAPDSFWNASDAELAQAFNGIGAAHWPTWMRVMLTALLRPFQAAALIHDWEYSQKIKNYRAFTVANWHLGVNIIREALYDCHPGVIPAGALAALLCQSFGWRAYKNGYINEVSIFSVPRGGEPQAKTIPCAIPRRHEETRL